MKNIIITNSLLYPCNVINSHPICLRAYFVAGSKRPLPSFDLPVGVDQHILAMLGFDVDIVGAEKIISKA